MKIDVVLVRPKYGFNVGSVSRVMANLAAHRLILIDPLCELDHEARKGAAGAQKRLFEATRYSSWNDFFKNEEEGVRLAFCGKTTKQMEHKNFYNSTDEIAEKIKSSSYQTIQLIFGTEDDGLSESDLEYANLILTLPTADEFRSLNLSHAVLLAIHILQMRVVNKLERTGSSSVATEAGGARFEFPDQVLREWLETLGFDIESRDTSAYTVLKRVLLGRMASSKELRVLSAIVQQTVRKLKGKS